ncbi:MAG: hypothetical protein AB7R90_17705 [Reyranellaceae bacterium]
MIEDLATIAVEIRPAPRLTLHGPTGDGAVLARTDCNSPVLRQAGRALAFVSHYAPRGRTWRRAAADPFDTAATLQQVRLLDDPAPTVGKWIESVWREPQDGPVDGGMGGRLFGWYHAEEPADCPALLPRRLFVPHIGALLSDDDGASWRFLGEVLRAPRDQIDCGFANGFVTGGYGDFCVVAEGDFFYLHYSSYVADQAAQGVCVARYPIAARERPAGVQHWRDGVWRMMGDHELPHPLLPAQRGWRHADPESFWGPALHFNRGLECWAMLLNHAQGGRDIHQEGIYVAFNRRLADPGGWTQPRRIVQGGFWYPQAIGLGPEDGDASADLVARFFIAGVSEWQIRFGPAAAPGQAGEVKIAKAPLDPGW